MKRIAVIPGDGIGPEVVREAVRVLKHFHDAKLVELEFVDFDWGAEKFLRDGVTLPPGALEMLTDEFDAILAGAFGDPRVPSNKHAEDILLGMRRGLDLYINLRPVRLLNERLTPLVNRKPEQIDFVVFRENTEGAYCGAGGFLKYGTADEVALQDEVNTRRGVERSERMSELSQPGDVGVVERDLAQQCPPLARPETTARAELVLGALQ